MNIYEATVRHGWGSDTRVLTIAARTPRKVIELVEKIAKKSYWSEFEIKKIEYIKKIDATQK